MLQANESLWNKELSHVLEDLLRYGQCSLPRILMRTKSLSKENPSIKHAVVFVFGSFQNFLSDV